MCSYVSERDMRRRATANWTTATNSRAPRPSPSRVARRRIKPADHEPKPSEKVKVLKRSKSEPSLWKPRGGEADEGVLYRPETCMDIFESLDNSVTRSQRNCYEVQGYDRDAKVVINVTVEGSPGPIRAMVKLGSNIEETIELVVKKYNEEGRTPHLDKDAASTCEVHHSSFSLHSLSKSGIIADVGSRSFYLRKCSSSNHCSDDSTIVSTSSNQLETSSPLSFFPSFIARKIYKVIRRKHKFWKILGCIPLPR